MSPSYVSVDLLDDSVNFSSGAASKRNLLLAPPSVAAHEEKLRDLFATYDRSVTDVHMLDRLSAGLATLPPATYDLILVIADANGARRPEGQLNRSLYDVLVPSMSDGAKLQFQGGALEAEAREAILAGLMEKDGAFEKFEEEAVSIPLRFGAKKKINGAPEVKALPLGVSLDDYNDDDELIDEDGLLSEEDLNRPIQIPPECQPKPGQKRRRACKDCSCGLAGRLEAEDRARQAKANEDLNILRLKPDDLDEMDFTVKGKTGSCNSCSLGDAFRCADCPYIGLPPFKPGEEVKIMNDVAQF